MRLQPSSPLSPLKVSKLIAIRPIKVNSDESLALTNDVIEAY